MSNKTSLGAETINEINQALVKLCGYSFLEQPSEAMKRIQQRLCYVGVPVKKFYPRTSSRVAVAQVTNYDTEEKITFRFKYRVTGSRNANPRGRYGGYSSAPKYCQVCIPQHGHNHNAAFELIIVGDRPDCLIAGGIPQKSSTIPQSLNPDDLTVVLVNPSNVACVVRHRATNKLLDVIIHWDQEFPPETYTVRTRTERTQHMVMDDVLKLANERYGIPLSVFSNNGVKTWRDVVQRMSQSRNQIEHWLQLDNQFAHLLPKINHFIRNEVAEQYLQCYPPQQQQQQPVVQQSQQSTFIPKTQDMDTEIIPDQLYMFDDEEWPNSTQQQQAIVPPPVVQDFNMATTNANNLNFDNTSNNDAFSFNGNSSNFGFNNNNTNDTSSMDIFEADAQILTQRPPALRVVSTDFMDMDSMSPQLMDSAGESDQSQFVPEMGGSEWAMDVPASRMNQNVTFRTLSGFRDSLGTVANVNPLGDYEFSNMMDLDDLY